MTNQSVTNFEIIDSIVTKHFALKSESLKLFREVLHNRDKKLSYIDEQFHSLLDEDLRAYFPVKAEIKEQLDDGWVVFKTIFYDFLFEYNLDITYDNYANNKIIINKNEVKLFKFIKKWYMDQSEESRIKFGQRVCSNIDSCDYSNSTDFEMSFKRASEKIGTMKLPDKDLKVVLSFNFADWFLVSTGESWSSCLNLDSDYDACYWSGLPGLITDPNRILLYVTDGKTKKYKDIITNKSITRTWGLLNNDDVVFPVRHYPLQIISDNAISNLFPFKVFPGSLESGSSQFGVGKHPLKDILKNSFGESVYIYQDGTCFEIDDTNIVTICSGHSGYHKVVFDSNSDGPYLDGDTNYEYCDGLSGLISSGCDLSNCKSSGCTCDECENSFSEDFMYYVDGGSYCQDCYNELYVSCESCGETMNRDEAFYSPDGEAYCEHHFNQRFFTCEECNEVYSVDDMREHNGRSYCSSCFSEKYVECDECGETFVRKSNPAKYKDIDDGIFCNKCFEGKYTECSSCSSIIESEDAQEVNGKLFCKSCVEKEEPINTQGAA